MIGLGSMPISAARVATGTISSSTNLTRSVQSLRPIHSPAQGVLRDASSSATKAFRSSLGARSPLAMYASLGGYSGVRCWDADDADAWPETTRLLSFQATSSTAEFGQSHGES